MGKRTPGVFQRGRHWYISWNDQFGRRHREAVGPSYTQAVRARVQRLADNCAARFGLRQPRKAITLGKFIEARWRPEATIAFKPSTLRAYETLLRHHLLPFFGHYPLPAITRAEVKRFIAEKARQQRFSYSTRNPNPDRPMLSPKTIKNAVGLLTSVIETATVDYGLLEANPIRGMLRRKHFPAYGIGTGKVKVLEPQDFMKAVRELRPPVLQAVLFATLTGLRWGEQVALRTEDIELRNNRIRVTRALYKRVQQTPKTRQSVRDVNLCPTARRILEGVPWTGFVFSDNGTRPIGDGSWVKRQWHAAQIRAGVGPIRWHDLRHQFVSLLIAAGKHPKYIANQAGHASAGFTLDRYGHLLEQTSPEPVEWIDDLLGGRGEFATLLCATGSRPAEAKVSTSHNCNMAE